MIVYAEIECLFYEGHSLKAKRSVMKRMFAKIQQSNQIAVTELDHHDVWQRTKIGIVAISTSYSHAEQVIQHAIEQVDRFTELERTITHVDRL